MLGKQVWLLHPLVISCHIRGQQMGQLHCILAYISLHSRKSLVKGITLPSIYLNVTPLCSEKVPLAIRCFSDHIFRLLMALVAMEHFVFMGYLLILPQPLREKKRELYFRRVLCW